MGCRLGLEQATCFAYEEIPKLVETRSSTSRGSSDRVNSQVSEEAVPYRALKEVLLLRECEADTSVAREGSLLSEVSCKYCVREYILTSTSHSLNIVAKSFQKARRSATPRSSNTFAHDLHMHDP